MDQELFEEDIRISSQRLIQIIKEEYEKSETGIIQGYLDQRLGVITKKEALRLRRLEGDEPASYDRGSVICREPNEERRALVSLSVSLHAKQNLEEAFKDYPFTKFEIDFRSFQEYRYYKNKLWRWRKTLYLLPYFIVDISW